MDELKEPVGGLLASIGGPGDVRALPLAQLPRLAEEVRQFIIREVSVHPGHLGSSLGVVELTVALLHAYDPPTDSIVWDVGHQAYPYKILTGRRDAFRTNRQLGGLAGFPQRAESEHDAFGTGHSSTSISAAYGIAEARRQMGLPGATVAVIGDGALTGGLAYEALNNAGGSATDLLVILNDNNMSIDPNVGAMSEYLLDITTSRGYNRAKDSMWHLLGRVGGHGKRKGRFRALAQQIDMGIKGAILKQSNLFEVLGFRYFGPIEGHDPVYLAQILSSLRQIPGPKLLHCITKKGKGFEPAEKDQTLWHAPGCFNPESGQRVESAPAPGASRKYQDIFAETLIQIMERHPRVVGITPAMPTGSSLRLVMDRFPARCYDVGIAEAHAVTFAAGLATQGIVPFCVIYSSFLQRAYDSLIHDVALQNLHVVFCLDRGGLVGEDGATHHGVFDLAYLRGIPHFTVCAASSGAELESMMQLALCSTGPWAIRYPRGAAEQDHNQVTLAPVVRGKGLCEATGERVALVTLGSGVAECLKARAILQEHGYPLPAVYNMRFLRPLDRELLSGIAGEYSAIYTVEDGVVEGGFGSAVGDYLLELGFRGEFHRLGVPDRFVPHGTVRQLRDLCGFSGAAIARGLMHAAGR